MRRTKTSIQNVQPVMDDNAMAFSNMLISREKGRVKLVDAVSLHFMYYNFCRIHQTLRITPAMETKVTDHIWTIEEILNLL
jgi:hypothetical protein